MKNRKWIFSGLIMMLFVTSVSAQQNRGGRFNADKFHEYKWEFMMKEVKLSPAEADAVKPVFIEFEKKNWELHLSSRQLMDQVRKQTISEKEYSQLNDKMINTEIKRAQYMREYHVKLRKLLKPETLFLYYGAQKSFERQLLQKGPPAHERGFNRKQE